MKKTTCALALSALFAPSLVFATTATSLSSFGGVEEPTVYYTASSNSFKDDTYVNITDRGSGVSRMYLRYSHSAWDGDRATTSTDRQRAEVKVLGNRQQYGETFEYQSTWKTVSTFKKGSKFCHITQVKGYGGGDIDEPLVTVSVDSDTSAAVKYCTGTASGLTTARTFSFAAGSSRTVKVRLKVSTSANGEIRASVNGDSLSGKTALAMYRPDAPEYQPKWGLYRGLDNNQPFGNDYIEHSAVSANKL